MKIPLAILIIGIVLAGIRWAFWPHGRLPKFRAAYTRVRLRLRLHPGRGHATVLELWLRWARLAAFRGSRRSRRSLGAWRRLWHPREHSIFLGRAHYGHGLRLPVDHHGVIVAPPREGKTALISHVILRYPGPVMSTTTKADVFTLTSGVRSMAGPVHVFNPQGIGNVPSTFRWSPVDGADNPAVAIRRADAFASAVSMSGTEDSSFWSSKASSYLRGLFHAAALTGGDMRLVVRWALGSAQDAEDILAGAGAGQWAAELAELRGEAQKTAATVRMVLSRALAFMTDPALAQSVLPARGGGLDFAEFLAARGTLYMIADSEHDDSPLAPLFACMASELHCTAELNGQAAPGGRLDPPLLMALDEIVQTCPVPLPIWAADSGGKGIQILSVAHGEAQLASRWGEHGKQVILDTAGVKIFLPSISDTGTLEMASKLCGQAAFREHGHDQHSRHDVMTPDMIRQLPPGRALLIRGGLRPVIVMLPRAWKDGAYKRARRAGLAVAALTPAPALQEHPRPPGPPALPGAAWPHGPAGPPGFTDLAAGASSEPEPEDAGTAPAPDTGQPGTNTAYPWSDQS